MSRTAAGVLEQARGRKLSDLLVELAADDRSERICIGDLAEAMHDQAFGALMFLLAAPNLLPSPPGTSIVVGPPLVLLSGQLMLRKPLRLPHAIAARSVTRARFATWVGRIAPWLERAEGLLRPRLAFAVEPPADRAIGVMVMILAGVLVLPIPLGNMLPALAICLLTLGLAEGDGLWVLIGAAAAAAAIAVVSGVLYALARITWFVLMRAIGG